MPTDKIITPAVLIVAQEAAGQRMLVENGAMLPKRFMPDVTREQVTTATGIVFHEDHDEVFVNVTLPQHWEIVATDHNMWTTLLDEQGGQRARIFYKAAFYDRNGYTSFCQRYEVFVAYNDAQETRTIYVRDNKFNKLVYEAGMCFSNAKGYKEYDRLQDQAVDWLKRNYPDFREPFAYWSA